MPPPLTLEFQNRIVHDTVLAQVTTDKPEGVDITIADFNQVMWHLSTNEGVLNVSVSCKCWASLSKNGSDALLKTIYGTMVQRPEPKYDVTLAVKTGAPMPEAEAEVMASKVAQLARNMMAGVFFAKFDNAAKRTGGAELLQIDYRPNESVWFKLDGDRVIVIFSIFFDDADDVVIGRVFLSEVGKLVQGAPAVDVHLKDPPKELQGIRGLRAHGYASFLVEARHFAPKQRDTTVNIMMQFRNYLHYHIKCSKAYLHIRMRNRVNLLLQVLNRAKQEVKSDAAKKPFTRK